MSVRKRRWTSAGVDREAWICDYVDAQGKRRLKTFGRKKEADEFEKRAGVEVLDGVHVADSASITVEEAGKAWLRHSEANRLERTTVKQYRTHVDLHIVPFLGTKRLTELSVPSVRAFEDRLRTEGRSPPMIRKVLVSLGSLLADAQENGTVSRNVVRELRVRRRSKEERQVGRHKAKIQAGVDMPTPAEVRAIIAALQPRWRPVILTAIFSGLRASELRGLRWSDVDLAEKRLTVRQRADAYREIGSPKSKAGQRTVPLPPIVVNMLKEWKLACPPNELDLVFPTKAGGIESHAAILRQGYMAAQVAAGIAVDRGKVNGDGEPVLEAKYAGLHSLRHFYASWLINRKADGGLELPAKMVQERLGHSSIVMTMDVYGHLFPTGDEAAELAAAESALLG
jgi:integrase